MSRATNHERPGVYSSYEASSLTAAAAGGGGVAAGAGAGRPKEDPSSRAARICLRYPGRGLLEPSECAHRRKAGWYRGKLALSSREQNRAPGTFCCLHGSRET